MTDHSPDILVLRKGTEGLSTEEYASEIRKRLSNHEVVRASTPAEETALIQNARVATGTTISNELLPTANNLELFVSSSSGYGHQPLTAMEEQGVGFVNAAGIHAPGIAEQALSHCLVHARRIHVGWRRKQTNQWRHYKASELHGSTVTVVGLGSIGHAIVQRLEGFEVDTLGVRYSPEKGGPTDEVLGFDMDEFHTALAQTDYLILSTPLTDTTRGLIGKEEFDTLPPNAMLVNVCRGSVVDTDELVNAIQQESISGAALDVTDPEPLPQDHPLWNMDNVFITPHMAGHTPKHWERLADILATNVRKLDNGETNDLENQILAPDPSMSTSE